MTNPGQEERFNSWGYPTDPGAAASAAPGAFTLSAHPNPFRGTSAVRFTLPTAGDHSLVVYDVAGRVVKRLVDGKTGAGVHDAVWDGTNAAGQRVSSGVYFYRLTTDRFSKTKKMVMLK